MPNNLHELVQEFHETYIVPVRTTPTLGTPEERALRIALIEEEFNEFIDATKRQSLVDMYDALIDILWVTSGALHTFGLPLNEGLEVVAASNRSKLGEDGKPIYSPTGKVLKGPFFFKPEPELTKIIERHTSATQENAGGSREDFVSSSRGDHITVDV